jgi:thymidylate synthase ThyX
VPPEIEEAGLKEEYDSVMAKAKMAWEKIAAKFPYEAQYVVPLGYRKRALFAMNLRELHHFIPLRTGPLGHISYRLIAYRCYEEVAKVHPILAKYIKVNQVP